MMCHTKYLGALPDRVKSNVAGLITYHPTPSWSLHVLVERVRNHPEFSWIIKEALKDVHDCKKNHSLSGFQDNVGAHTSKQNRPINCTSASHNIGGIII